MHKFMAVFCGFFVAQRVEGAKKPLSGRYADWPRPPGEGYLRGSEGAGSLCLALEEPLVAVQGLVVALTADVVFPGRLAEYVAQLL